MGGQKREQHVDVIRHHDEQIRVQVLVLLARPLPLVVREVAQFGSDHLARGHLSEQPLAAMAADGDEVGPVGVRVLSEADGPALAHASGWANLPS